MQEKPENGRPPLAADEVSVKKVIIKLGEYRRYVVSRWRLLLIVGIVGAAIGFAYETLRAPVYTAECTFVLEEADKASGGMGQYSALASMVGIDVGSSSGLFQGDNIIQLYKSRLMLEETLLSQATFNGKKQLLIERYIENNGLKKAWAENVKLKNINFRIPKQEYTVSHDSIMGQIVSNINKNNLVVDKPDKKLSMISVKFKSKDQLFAKAFAENILSTVNTFYIQTKTKGITQNVKLLQHQADSVHRALNSAIGRTAAALDPNPDPNMQTLRVPSQRRQVDVQSSSTIYGEVIRNLEIAKAALQRAMPLIQVIDEPKLPLPNDKTGRLKALVTGGLIAVFIAVVWLLMVKVYKGIMY